MISSKTRYLRFNYKMNLAICVKEKCMNPAAQQLELLTKNNDTKWGKICICNLTYTDLLAKHFTFLFKF